MFCFLESKKSYHRSTRHVKTHTLVQVGVVYGVTIYSNTIYIVTLYYLMRKEGITIIIIIIVLLCRLELMSECGRWLCYPPPSLNRYIHEHYVCMYCGNEFLF